MADVENQETLLMDKATSDLKRSGDSGSMLRKAVDPDCKLADEAGWTIPGLDEQYKLQNSASSIPPEAPKTPDSLAPEVMVGRVILGQYTLEKLLGEGGMGSVYLARQTTMERPAAIKFLLPELGTNKEMVQRFYREAKSASVLKHPCIVQNYNFGCTEDNLMYLAMEFVDGLTLYQYLRLHGSMPWPEVCDLGAKLADALAVAHASNVIHRDLKPENIMLQTINDRDIPKILDFGIAKVVSNDGHEATLTRLGTVFGTPSYMSPEQAQGIPISYSTDIYSLGVIFYVMLAGCLPITANSPAAQLMAVNLQPPTPFSAELKAKTPRALQELVFKMLEKKPEDRPQSMLEVRNALEQIKAASMVDNADTSGKKSSSLLSKGVTVALVAAAAAGGWFGHEFYAQQLPAQEQLELQAIAPEVPAVDGATEEAKAKLLESSSQTTPDWLDSATEVEISDKLVHFHSQLSGVVDRIDGTDLLRADLTDMAVVYMITGGIANTEPFYSVVVRPSLDAREAVLSKLQSPDLAAEERTALLAQKNSKQLAIAAMVETRFPELFDDISIYWEKWQEVDGSIDYKINALAKCNPYNFNGQYYFEGQDFKKLGLRVNHFYPAQVWVHGAINGAVIMAVTPNSPAALADLRPGDVILSIDGKIAEGLSGALDYFNKWEKRQPVKRVEIELSRQGEKIKTYIFDKTKTKSSKQKKHKK